MQPQTNLIRSKGPVTRAYSLGLKRKRKLPVCFWSCLGGEEMRRRRMKRLPEDMPLRGPIANIFSVSLLFFSPFNLLFLVLSFYVFPIMNSLKVYCFHSCCLPICFIPIPTPISVSIQDLGRIIFLLFPFSLFPFFLFFLFPVFPFFLSFF